FVAHILERHAEAFEHRLHAHDESRRTREVVDRALDTAQMALQQALVDDASLAGPARGRLLHLRHGWHEVEVRIPALELRKLLQEGSVLRPAVGVEEP